MEIKKITKITKFDAYTVNEFVRELVETRKESKTAIEELENKLQEPSSMLQELNSKNTRKMSEEEKTNHKEEKAKLRKEISSLKKEKKQIEDYISKMENEKERIVQKLSDKIQENENKIKENQDKIEEYEKTIEENQEKMESLDPESDEYKELESANKDLNKKISSLNGAITRYNKKVNDLIEIKGNLETENVLEGLKPPKTITRARTLDGKRTRKNERIEPEKTDPEKTEPEKTEPEKKEPVKTEPEKTEPKKTEPVKTEPEKTEPKKTEPVKTNPVKTNSVKTESVKTNPAKTEPVKAEPVKKEPENTVSPKDMTQQQLEELLKKQQSKKENSNPKISKIKVDPLTLSIKYQLEGEDVEREFKGLQYEKNDSKKAQKFLNKNLKIKTRTVAKRLDPNIVKLIIGVYGKDNATEPLQQYINVLSGKEKKDSGFGIEYNLKDIHKSNLTLDEIKNVSKIAKKAKRSSNGIVKVEKDSLLKRAFYNIKSKISPFKLLADGKREQEIYAESKRKKDFVSFVEVDEAKAIRNAEEKNKESMKKEEATR